MLEIEKLGLVEMDSQEVKETEGGWVDRALALISFGIYIYNEGHDFVRGFNDTAKKS